MILIRGPRAIYEWRVERNRYRQAQKGAEKFGADCFACGHGYFHDTVVGASKHAAAQNHAGHGEVNHQAGDIDEGGHKRRGCAGGIRPALRNTKGSIEPATVPNKTTPIRLHATVSATNR